MLFVLGFLFCLSWDNHTGWLGVKYQVTYCFFVLWKWNAPPFSFCLYLLINHVLFICNSANTAVYGRIDKKYIFKKEKRFKHFSLVYYWKQIWNKNDC